MNGKHILFYSRLKELNIICKTMLPLLVLIACFSIKGYSQSENKKIRIIMIGAHPDDCDQDAGGTSILFASIGHAVKFLSVTNGDAGHQTEKGTGLAKRRFLEAQEAGKRFGVVYDVLDNHDGQLLPTLKVRLQIIKKSANGMLI